MAGKMTLSKAKKKCWEWFSKYIRQRDAKWSQSIDPTIPEDHAFCCTCGTLYPVKKLQAGHFIPGRHNSILLEERGVHAQCYHCNVGLKGNPRKYDKFMKEKYGQEVIDELDSLDYEEKKYTIPELEELAEKYRNLYLQLHEMD